VVSFLLWTTTTTLLCLIITILLLSSRSVHSFAVPPVRRLFANINQNKNSPIVRSNTIMSLSTTALSSSAVSDFSAVNSKPIVKVTTYNVLSSHLCEPEYFMACKPEFLDPKYRLKQLKLRLDKETTDGAIICLQEVSTLWAGALHAYFASKGYYFVNTAYGHRFNGYMGVGIAVPLSRYQIEDVDITRVADTKRGGPRPPKAPLPLQLIKSWLIEPIIKLLRAFNILRPVEESAWALTGSRSNQMVCMRLVDKVANQAANSSTSSFVVGTYHMPCMFKLPGVMTIHTALSAQHIRRYAKGSPVIFCGDFNIKPQDTMYKYLISGEVDMSVRIDLKALIVFQYNVLHVQNPNFPVVPPGDNYSYNLSEPFRSAYKVASPISQEPEYTNWAKVRCRSSFFDDSEFTGRCVGARGSGIHRHPRLHLRL
jgi:2',5'-phosphodiesterase